MTTFITQQFASLELLMTILTAIIHILFAGAVARDAGKLVNTGEQTALVNGITWAFATLAGGVIVAAIYWFIHHSKFTRV